MNKEALVVDMWSYNVGGGKWFPSFLKAINDWEMETLINPFSSLGRTRIDPVKKDLLVWRYGEHLVNSIYKMQESNLAAASMPLIMNQ